MCVCSVLQMWVMALSVCFVFTVTIGTFPAITVEVKSTVADGGAWGERSTSLHSVTSDTSTALRAEVFNPGPQGPPAMHVLDAPTHLIQMNAHYQTWIKTHSFESGVLE